MRKPEELRALRNAMSEVREKLIFRLQNGDYYPDSMSDDLERAIAILGDQMARMDTVIEGMVTCG